MSTHVKNFPHLSLKDRDSTTGIVELRREIKKKQEKANNSAEKEEIKTCPLPHLLHI